MILRREGEAQNPLEKNWLTSILYTIHEILLLEVKMNALHRCFQVVESIKLILEEIGYTRACIYAWQKKYPRRSYYRFE